MSKPTFICSNSIFIHLIILRFKNFLNKANDEKSKTNFRFIFVLVYIFHDNDY